MKKLKSSLSKTKRIQTFYCNNLIATSNWKNHLQDMFKKYLKPKPYFNVCTTVLRYREL